MIQMKKLHELWYQHIAPIRVMLVLAFSIVAGFVAVHVMIPNVWGKFTSAMEFVRDSKQDANGVVLETDSLRAQLRAMQAIRQRSLQYAGGAKNLQRIIEISKTYGLNLGNTQALESFQEGSLLIQPIRIAGRSEFSNLIRAIRELENGDIVVTVESLQMTQGLMSDGLVHFQIGLSAILAGKP